MHIRVSLAALALWLMPQLVLADSLCMWRELGSAEVDQRGLAHKRSVIFAAARQAQKELKVNAVPIHITNCSLSSDHQFELGIPARYPNSGASHYALYITAQFIQENDDDELARTTMNRICRIALGMVRDNSSDEQQRRENRARAELCAAQLVQDHMAIEWLQKTLPPTTRAQRRPPQQQARQPIERRRPPR